MRPIMNPTDIERKLMKEMDERGIRYVFQYDVPTDIGNLHVDFAFPRRKIAVECDGDYWHGNPAKYKKRRLNRLQERNRLTDSERDKALKDIGWKLIRFWGSQIEDDVDGCIRTIEESLAPAKGTHFN
jgi:DNA mismatch endonuclease (patch repair protein)